MHTGPLDPGLVGFSAKVKLLPDLVRAGTETSLEIGGGEEKRVGAAPLWKSPRVDQDWCFLVVVVIQTPTGINICFHYFSGG